MNGNGNGNSQKQSQQEAGYGRGSPVKHCGLCRFFEGGTECSQVEGPISPFGLSKVYNPQPNPFGSKLGPRESAVIERMMATGPDQDEVVAGAPVPIARIGNKTYG